MPYFSSKFKKQQTPNGTMYWFQTCYTQDDINRNEKISMAVDGDVLYSEEGQLEKYNEEKAFSFLPEECNTEELKRQVFVQWLEDCSKCFTKVPSVEQCLHNSLSIWDSNVPPATIRPDEEDKDWILQWIPTRVKVDHPNYQIYWAPMYKTEYTRIPIDEEANLQGQPKREDGEEFVDLQEPEKVYTYDAKNTRLIMTQQEHGLQELNISDIPLSDSSALRLNFDDAQREKYRKRVREARIRAKLAHYRAERLASQFEERFGFYPEEDREEAQTEAEDSSED